MKKIFLRGIFEGRSELIEQFLKYAVVGGIAAVADIAVFYLLAGTLGINHLLSNSTSFIFGLLVNYFLSRQWVFGYSRHNFGRDFTLFAVIGAIGLGISNVILYILIDLGLLFKLLSFLGNDLVKLSAKCTAVFVVLFWNFFARKLIVFRVA